MALFEIRIKRSLIKISKCSSIGESMNLIEKKWNQKVTSETIIQEHLLALHERRMNMSYGITNRNGSCGLPSVFSLEKYSANEERGGKEKRSASIAYCCLDGECGRSVRPGL